MILAMDFHGSLRSRPGLRNLAAFLIREGNAVHVISAVAEGDQQISLYRSEIESWGIPFTGVHFIGFAGIADYAVGELKAAKMKEIGAVALWDDNHGIVRAVREAGFFCWHLGAD